MKLPNTTKTDSNAMLNQPKGKTDLLTKEIRLPLTTFILFLRFKPPRHKLLVTVRPDILKQDSLSNWKYSIISAHKLFCFTAEWEQFRFLKVLPLFSFLREAICDWKYPLSF